MTDIVESVGDAAAILLSEPSIGGDDGHCRALLLGDHEPAGILFVSYMRSPAACLDQLNIDPERGPAVAVITVGTASPSAPDGVDVRGMASAGDLTGLGIAIGETIADWHEPITVCFDSVTSMLQYVDLKTAYEFLHTTIGRLEAAGARSHFHIDPAAHDEQAVATVTSLVDARIRIENGSSDVNTR